jgi:hypothetical protein
MSICFFRYGLGFTLGVTLVFAICYQLNKFRTLNGDIRFEELSIGGLRPGLSLQEMQAMRGPCKPVSGPGLDRIEPFVLYNFPEDCQVFCREGHISHILGYTLDVKGTTWLKAGASAKVLKRLHAEVSVERLHKHEIRYWYPSLGLIVEVDGYSRIKAFELGPPEPVGLHPR